MRGYGRWLVGALLVVALAGGAVAAEVLAHPDGCHRWHSCPSDDGSYVCGDRGHCSECPNNQYCMAGRPRNATTAATRTPRPTKAPDPTRTPRPTQTREPSRAARAGESSASRSANSSAEAGMSGSEVARASAYSALDSSSADATDDLRGVAALAGTGAPLEAAPVRPGIATSTGPAGSADSRATPVVMAEYGGVRVIGPLQWAADGEQTALTGTVTNGAGQARTMVLTLFLLDAQGGRLGAVEAVLWDLAPGESRAFTQAVPPLAAPATDVSARLEPLVP